MPITDTIIIAAIVIAFAIFGIVLSWAEYQTRNLPAGSRENANSGKAQSRPVTVLQTEAARGNKMAAK